MRVRFFEMHIPDAVPSIDADFLHTNMNSSLQYTLEQKGKNIFADGKSSEFRCQFAGKLSSSQ